MAVCTTRPIALSPLSRIPLYGDLPWLLFGPVLALAAQLPTGCAPRDTRWGTSPTEVLEAQGTYGTPSEVTRYDHCNHRSLKWYRAPTPYACSCGCASFAVTIRRVHARFLRNACPPWWRRGRDGRCGAPSP